MRTGETDPRTRRFVGATRIVSARGVAYPDNLLRDDASTCDLPPGGAVLLDFGREMHGAVRFDVPIIEPKTPARVRVRFGESVSEALGEPDQDHAIHDHHVRLAWMGRTEVGETGFRFVHVENEEPEATIRVRVIQGVSIVREDPRIGTFRCSDPRLEEIWRIGADTVHLCMQDHVWDGPKRDRLVWIGDLHPEAMVVATVWGNHPIIASSLDHVRDATPLPAWMNGISSYSLWWILVHADWHERFAGGAHLAEQGEYLAALLEQIANRLDDDASERLDGHRFLEWPTARDGSAIDAGLQALCAMALARGAGLLARLGRARESERFAALADRARRVVRPTGSKQAAALQVLAGSRDALEANQSLLSVDPFRGISTFYGYYVLQARALAGDHQGCLDLIRTYWGGMCAMGATTFWEGFEIDWMEGATRIDEMPVPGRKDIHADFGDHCYVGLRHSLCHGWAAGPTAWLSEHVLGVRTGAHPTPWATVDPRLADLEWAEGSVPTAAGVIEVAHRRRDDGSIETRIQAPEGVTMR